MGRIVGSVPILLVRDVVVARDDWRDRPGFDGDRLWREPPDFRMPVVTGMWSC